MPERPDLRKIAGNIREALAECDRDTLLSVLTYVFKEYVVEGPPPMLVHQAERLEDLEGLSFAELVAALQTQLDVPELALFQVEGGRVSVRVGGVLTPLVASATPVEAPAAPAQAPAPTPAPPPRAAGVQVVETTLGRRPAPSTGREAVDDALARGRGDLAGLAERPAAPVQAAEAPRPRGGVSVRGRAGGATAASGAAPAVQPTPPRGGDSAPASPGEPKEPAEPGDEDSAAMRFSLLELD